MSDTQKQLTLQALAEWAAQCDRELALLRWQVLAAQVREKAKAA